MANERHHNCCDHRDQNGISPLRYLADNICPKICSHQNVKPKNQRDMEPTGDIKMLSDGPEQGGKQPDAKRLPIKKGAGRLRAENPTGKKGNLERQQQFAQIAHWGRHKTTLRKANFVYCPNANG